MPLRVTGKLGSVYLDGVKIADIYDWEYEMTAEAMDCTCKGEGIQRIQAGGVAARVRARRYVQTTTVMALSVKNVALGGSGGLVDFTLYLIDANNSFAKIVGQGYIIRGMINSPQDLATDEIEIAQDGDVSFAWT